MSCRNMPATVLLNYYGNEKLPWRALLLVFAKRFQHLVNPRKEIADKSAFILDDTTLTKTGRKIEKIYMVFDHTAGKGTKPGFKDLTLGLYHGKSLSL